MSANIVNASAALHCGGATPLSLCASATAVRVGCDDARVRVFPLAAGAAGAAARCAAVLEQRPGGGPVVACAYLGPRPAAAAPAAPAAAGPAAALARGRSFVVGAGFRAAAAAPAHLLFAAAGRNVFVWSTRADGLGGRYRCRGSVSR